jgi:hypothetical protein
VFRLIDRRCANIPIPTYGGESPPILIEPEVNLHTAADQPSCSCLSSVHPFSTMASRTAIILLALVGLAAVVSKADAGGHCCCSCTTASEP